MNAPARGGYNRGSRPARPGDLTAKLAARNQKQAEAAKRPVDLEAIRDAAIREGIDAGWEAGFAAGWDALADFLTEQGIDVAAIVALDDEPDDAEGDE